MAVNNPVYVNESGLPLNAIEWLETHHRSKAPEREQMIRDLKIKKGSRVVDAGCGPGLWIPLLAQAIGRRGRITGVDISPEALVTAQQRNQEYSEQVQYKLGSIEQLPVQPGVVDFIFSANVSQYLPDPVETFRAMGRYLKPGGRIAIKDIDFGSMRFYSVDRGLQERVFSARKRWEHIRVNEGYAFEDSWVGGKLAGYLEEAGFEKVQERQYRIVRRYPLPEDFRFYLQGITRWFVCEGAPLLSSRDEQAWLDLFMDGPDCVLDSETFISEETEYMVSGVWTKSHSASIFYLDAHVERREAALV
ncbi:MAG TPA: methyltransferase domain-containing protein [Ktedonobacteraceae bacterium]|jgi:ubiquinone/menaquinone biosynthesis C-methylase UbiE|nr:methyltransferase domain-containing protein [Ktedonobacteraceae bacterium]